MTQEAAIEPQQEVEELLEEETQEETEETTEEESTEETAEGQETEETAEEETEEVAEEKPKKKKQPFAERVEERKKELAFKTYQMREQERTTNAAIEELKKLQGQAEVKDLPKPKSENFDTHEEYQDSLMDWTANNAVNKYAKKQLEKQTISTEEQIEAKRGQDWQYNRQKGLDKYDNFAENEGMLVNVLTHYGNKNISSIIMDSPKEVGIELVQHLGKNWEEAERIAQLPELQQAMEIGAIKERLVNKPKKKLTKTFAPTGKIRGGGGGAPKKASPSDTEAWMEMRNKQERGQ